MGFKQKRGVAMCAVGIGIASLLETGCSDRTQQSETQVSISPRKGPGSTAVATTVETTLPSTTTTLPPSTTTTTYMVESSRTWEEAERLENARIIASQIVPSLDSIGVPHVNPINEDKAEVTAQDEFIIGEGCGAIVTVNTLDIVGDGTVRPATARRLGFKFIGPLNIIADGSSYTEANMPHTYNILIHEDPGFVGLKRNEFEPGDQESVKNALISMSSIVTAACALEIIPSQP